MACAGYHWVDASVDIPASKGTTKLKHLPISYSNVGYTYINDEDVIVEKGPDDNTVPSLSLAGTHH